MLNHTHSSCNVLSRLRVYCKYCIFKTFQFICYQNVELTNPLSLKISSNKYIKLTIIYSKKQTSEKYSKIFNGNMTL